MATAPAAPTVAQTTNTDNILGRSLDRLIEDARCARRDSSIGNPQASEPELRYRNDVAVTLAMMEYDLALSLAALNAHNARGADELHVSAAATGDAARSWADEMEVAVFDRCIATSSLPVCSVVEVFDGCAWTEDGYLDVCFEEIAIAGDDEVASARCREHDDVVVVWIASEFTNGFRVVGGDGEARDASDELVGLSCGEPFPEFATVHDVGKFGE